MFPLGSDPPVARISFTNTLLVVVNVAVYAYQVWAAQSVIVLSRAFGMIPERLTRFVLSPTLELWRVPVTLLTSLFLHAGALHLAGNMLYLLIFGPPVERRLGKVRYLAFYLGAGVIAGLAMVWMFPRSSTPVIGASGAIAGVLGAYFVMYPRARIVMLLPMPFMITAIRVPAVFYLLAWFGFQLYAGTERPGGLAAHSVAWWAHVGGFLFGVAVGPLMAKTFAEKRRPRAAVSLGIKPARRRQS